MGDGDVRPLCQPNHKSTSATAAYQSRLSRRCVLNRLSKRESRHWSVSWSSIHQREKIQRCSLTHLAGRQFKPNQLRAQVRLPCAQIKVRGVISGGADFKRAPRRQVEGRDANHRGRFFKLRGLEAELNVRRQLRQRAGLRTHNATPVVQQINQFKKMQLQITSTWITQRSGLNDRICSNIDAQTVIWSLQIRLLMSWNVLEIKVCTWAFPGSN